MCVGSKAVGKQGGVVKNAVIIPVKLVWNPAREDYIDALYAIYNYATDPARNYQGKGVVTQSTNPTASFFWGKKMESYEVVVDALLAIGIPIVVAGGNEGLARRVHALPFFVFLTMLSLNLRKG